MGVTSMVTASNTIIITKVGVGDPVSSFLACSPSPHPILDKFAGSLVGSNPSSLLTSSLTSLMVFSVLFLYTKSDLRLISTQPIVAVLVEEISNAAFAFPFPEQNFSVRDLMQGFVSLHSTRRTSSCLFNKNFSSHFLKTTWLPLLVPFEYSWTNNEAQVVEPASDRIDSYS